MAESRTHLELHTGYTKQWRISATAPTDPTPEEGDVYIDNTVGAEAIGIYDGSSWLFVSLQV